MHLKTHIILPSYPYRDHNAKYQHGSGLDAIIKPSSSYTDFIPTTRTVKTAIIKIIIVILLFFFFKSMFTTRIKIIERQVNLKSKLHHNFDNEDKNFINLNTMRLQFQNANRIRLRRLKETCQKMDLLVKLTAESASADSQVNELLNYQMMPKFTSKINQARFKTSWKIGSVAEDQQDPKLHFQHRGLNQPEENDNFLINDWAMCIPPKQGTTSWQRLLIAASQNKQVKEVHWNYGLYHRAIGDPAPRKTRRDIIKIPKNPIGI